MGLAARLGIVFAVLVAATALLTSGISFLSTNRQVAGDIDSFLRERADEITSGQRSGPRDGKGRRDASQQAVAGDVGDAVEQATDGRGDTSVDADSIVQAIDIDGTVISTNGIELPVTEADIELAQSPGRERLRTVSIDEVDYRILTAHFSGGGAIQVARSLADSTSLRGSLRSRSIVIGVLMSAVAGLAGWLVARRATKPLRDLTASVESVAATQDLSQTIEIERTDEIGRLADTFDDMLRALSLSRDQQHRLVQDAAHELRTPLTSINANVDLLVHAPELDMETRVDTLRSTKAELSQLNGLLTEIIELATDARPQPESEPFQLGPLVAGVVDSFQSRRSLTVELALADDGFVVDGHPEGIERAVANLLSNAEKYGNGDGPIEVAVAGGQVTVRDRGVGVDEADLPNVFMRFYRSDVARSQPGSGLGLAIVEKIITDHGGRVWLRNHPSEGAEAGFTLPPTAA